MICPNCGKMIPDTVRYCPACGANVQVSAPAAPPLFDEGEDFLAGSVPRYEDSGNVLPEEGAGVAPESTFEKPAESPSEAPLDSPFEDPAKAPFESPFEDSAGSPYESPDEDLYGEPAPAASPSTITSMYGEQYRADDARYSQGADLSGLNLLHPSDSPEDADNRRTAGIVLGIFGALCLVAVIAAAFVFSSLLSGISIPQSGSSGGDGVWDFLTRRRPSYAGYTEDDGFSFDQYAPFYEDSGDSDDFWDEEDDDFWDEEDEADASDVQDFPESDDLPVLTPDLNFLPWEEYAAVYRTPSELGSDLYSGTVRIEGDLYQFPMQLSALLGNGWEVTAVNGEPAAQDSDLLSIAPKEYGYLRLERDGHVISSLIYANEFSENCVLHEAMIVSLQCRDTDSFTMDLTEELRIGAKGVLENAVSEYGFTPVQEGPGTTYYLSFAPSSEASAEKNTVTLYDYESDGTLDAVNLFYTAPFAPK